MPCPGEEELLALGAGGLADASGQALREHLATCELCLGVALSAARSAAAGASAASGPRRIGRFELGEVLGKGGMGTVCAAWDPLLERPVAIKLLPTRLGGLDGPAREALVAEARGLARLRHENVVTVYDAGECEGEVYLAMERVEGEPLDRWLAAQPRSWRQIAAVFVEVGRGLVAAHRAGIVHRDVKPGNILVGAGGQVRVIDFGIAQLGFEAGARAADTADVATTWTGSVVGTPAYAAPEQLDGEGATPRSDVFSFAATLHEALTGQRPFAGNTIWSIRLAIADGPPATPRSLPRPLRELLSRCLREDPAARPADMSAVLALLDGALARRRRALAAAAALALAGVAAGAWAAGDPADPCAAVADDAGEIWRTHRSELRAAFGADEAAWAATERAARDFEARWSGARRAVCEAARRGESAATDRQHRIACLDGSLAGFDAAARLIAGGETRRAVDALLAANDPRGCTSSSEFLDAPPLPAGTVARRARGEVARRIARAEMLAIAGRLDEARRAAEGALAEARDLEAPALHARAAQTLGRLTSAAVQSREATGRALALHREARLRAAEAGSPSLEAEALADMAFLELQGRGAADAARDHLEHATALAARLRDQPLSQAAVRLTVAGVLAQIGDLGGADQALDQASAALEREAERDSVRYREARILYLSAAAELAGARLDAPEVAALRREALDLAIDVYGPVHWQVANLGDLLGATLLQLGRESEGRELFRQAASMRRDLLPGNSAYLHDYAAALGEGDPARRLALLDRAREHGRRELSDAHPDLALLELERASVLSQLERHDRAVAAAERGIAGLRQIYGEGSSLVRGNLARLHDVQLAAGRVDEAIATGLAMVADDDPGDDVASAGHFLLASLHLDRNDYRRGCPHFRSFRARPGPMAALFDEVDDQLFALMELICDVEDGRGPVEAVRAARAELPDLSERGAEYLEMVAGMDAWLGARDRSRP